MILVIGEALIDLIENRYQAGAFNAIVGGANANVAIALARRGTPQQFLARISDDRFGKIIRERLEANGVGLDHAIAADELTTLAVVSIDSHGVPSYAFYVNGTADWGWTPSELPTDATLDSLGAKALQFGCLTMAMAPGNAVIEAWGERLYKEERLTISHDINMRPALGFEREVERQRVERVNQFSHLIKASDEDIEWLYGLEPGTDIDGIVNDWIGDSGRHVFVTRGGDGVSVYRPGGTRFDVPSRKINVVDTVGAGDTFCANLLGQLHDSDSLGERAFARLGSLSDDQLHEYVRVAGVAASITCERSGAEPPTTADLEAVLATI